MLQHSFITQAVKSTFELILSLGSKSLTILIKRSSELNTFRSKGCDPVVMLGKKEAANARTLVLMELMSSQIGAEVEGNVRF